MVQRVYLEVASKLVFAVSLEWPGWCRRGRDADDALVQLRHYAPRYGAVVGRDLTGEDFEVIGSIAGNSTTEFGAPRVQGPWDATPTTDTVRRAHMEIVRQCWSYFDDVVATSPEELAKGPRGGGRDRDQIVDHVCGAERSYASKIGVRIPPRTPWVQQREVIAERLTDGYANEKWPAEYSMRIIAWHVLDHAWEIEDKSV